MSIEQIPFHGRFLSSDWNLYINFLFYKIYFSQVSQESQLIRERAEHDLLNYKAPAAATSTASDKPEIVKVGNDEVRIQFFLLTLIRLN